MLNLVYFLNFFFSIIFTNKAINKFLWKNHTLSKLCIGVYKNINTYQISRIPTYGICVKLWRRIYKTFLMEYFTFLFKKFSLTNMNFFENFIFLLYFLQVYDLFSMRFFKSYKVLFFFKQEPKDFWLQKFKYLLLNLFHKQLYRCNTVASLYENIYYKIFPTKFKKTFLKQNIKIFETKVSLNLLMYHKLKSILVSFNLKISLMDLPVKQLNSFFVNPTLTFKKDFAFFLKKLYPVKYNKTVNVKYYPSLKFDSLRIYFLRKNKIFNKSRYSRNRQLYRTGVYWCFWVSIFLGWGLYFIFYRYTLNFGHLWWFIYFGVSAFIFVKSINYRFYNIKILLIEINAIIKWLQLFLIKGGGHYFFGLKKNFLFFKKFVILKNLISDSFLKCVLLSVLVFSKTFTIESIYLFRYQKAKDFFFSLLYPIF